MHKPPIIVWLRRDLRLSDNPALFHACKQDRPVLPVFIWAPQEAGNWAPGSAHRWWLHYSLRAFQKDLSTRNASLVLRAGDSLDLLEELIEETGATAVYWNTRYEPEGLERDRQIASALGASGIEVHTFAGCLLHQPDLVKTGSGSPYQVFTPFWKKLLETMEVPQALPAPEKIQHAPGQAGLQSTALEALDLLS